MLSTANNPFKTRSTNQVAIGDLVRHASDEARKEQRFVATGPLSGADDTSDFFGVTRDMSVVGTGLLCDRKISGELTLKAPQVTGNSVLCATTQWSRPAFGRWWIAGAKFRRRDLIQGARLWITGQLGRLRRRIERRQPFFARLRVHEQNTTGPGIAGCSLNISQNGIGVVTDEATQSRVGLLTVEFQDHRVQLRATRRWQQQICSDLFLSGWQFTPVTRALSDLAR